MTITRKPNIFNHQNSNRSIVLHTIGDLSTQENINNNFNIVPLQECSNIDISTSESSTSTRNFGSTCNTGRKKENG